MLILFYTVVVIAFSKVHYGSACDSTSQWMRSSILDKDGKMTIKWNFTDDEIIIMMMAQTKGWISVGFSSKRSNVTDVVVGWVTNKKPYVQDRFTERGTTEPTLDKTQSIELVGGEETENGTCVCFKRKLSACDDQDYTITEGITNVNWSFGDSDPQDGKIQMTKNAGQKLLHLLRVMYPKPSAKPYSLQGPNITVNSKQQTTLYWCTYHKIPPTSDPLYFVGFDAAIVKQNKDYVHHIVVYSCNDEEMDKLYSKIDPNGYDCQSESNIVFYSSCKTFQAIWAVGVEDQYFPPESGLPFGKPNATTYYRVEVHYDLTSFPPEFVDNSGLTLYTIKEKPKNQLGILMAAYQVSPMMVIPPGQTNFKLIATCDSKCLKQNIPKDGLTAIGVFFHGHKLATSMKLHIFRNKKEQKPLFEDNYYFEFQGFQLLKDEIKLLPDDILGVECIYDTSTKNQTILGNTATQDEMCLIYLLYYPVMNNLGYCGSFIKPQDILTITDIEKLGTPIGIPKCEGSDCQTPYAQTLVTPPTPILKPAKYANVTFDVYWKNYKNWTSTNVEKLQKMYLGNQNPVCSSSDKIYGSKETDNVQYPSDATPFKNPDSCKKNS